MRFSRRAFTILELLIAITILAVLFGLVMAALHQTQQSVLKVERATWLKDRRIGVTGKRKLPIRILFLGNSFTAVNDLPGTLKALADASQAKPPLEVQSQTPGGAKLKTHWDNAKAVKEIHDSEWDFVVLQEQSQTPLKRFGRNQFFYPYAKKLHQEIQKTNAITMFYMTWKRPDMSDPQKAWTDSYLKIATELKAEVAPAGMTFERVQKAYPNLKLFTDQNGHPSPAGTYLIACTFYGLIYDKSPEGLPASITTQNGTTVSVPQADAKQLQAHAWQAVKLAKRELEKGQR